MLELPGLRLSVQLLARREPDRLGERRRAMGSGSQKGWGRSRHHSRGPLRDPRRHADRDGRRPSATLLVLAMLGGGWVLGGDGLVSVGSCAQFVTTVRTSEPSYAPGQAVII